MYEDESEENKKIFKAIDEANVDLKLRGQDCSVIIAGLTEILREWMDGQNQELWERYADTLLSVASQTDEVMQEVLDTDYVVGENGMSTTGWILQYIQTIRGELFPAE